ncbi:MAG: RagB/SusD family nutrient uptake outer membrane protein [Bacteroidales bacterium]|nr:RagB/SusD family nutrient uptake outer membrane protein [Bacteroidales bacterium]
MKKFKIYLVYSFILCVILSGCDESFIDMEPKDQLTMDIALKSLENLEGNILGVYEKARSPYANMDASLYKIFYTDIVKTGTHILDQPDWNSMCTFEGFDATHEEVERIWNDYYSGLNRANGIIKKIDVVEYNRENPVAVQRRNTVLGEAYFFRAYLHHCLITYWDNIILADQVFSDPEQKYKLASKIDVYNLIESDLKTAIDLLPNASDVASRGKVSKGVARHSLSLVYLDLENWEGAAELAEQVISDPAYGFAPLDEIFSELNQDNKEIIFSFQFMYGQTEVNWTACMIAPLYDRVNGVSRTFEQGGRPWSRNIPNDYYWSLFEEGDLRLEAWHKLYWTYDIDTPDDPLPGTFDLQPDDPAPVDTVMKPNNSGDTVAFYLFARIGDTVTVENLVDIAGLGARAIEPVTTKYWEYDGLGRDIGQAESFKNLILYRVSQAYLIAAEGYLRSGTNLARGQELLDQLRARAGQGSIPLNESNLLDEQARELGFEGHRYPMLKRLGILYDRLQSYNSETYSHMLPYHVRWPLPKNFVDLTGVKQNEGYE